MSARAAVHWLGHRIELNRAAVIAGATMLGLLLAGLIVLYARDSAADDQRREEIAAVVRQNRAAIARIDALELPTPNNIKAAIARYLRRRGARARGPRSRTVRRWPGRRRRRRGR